MKRAPLTYRLMPHWSKEKRARLREIERDFHVRAFGEELARVNLDMTKEERLRYIDWMCETARKNGVPHKRWHVGEGYLEDEDFESESTPSASHIDPRQNPNSPH